MELTFGLGNLESMGTFKTGGKHNRPSLKLHDFTFKMTTVQIII